MDDLDEYISGRDRDESLLVLEHIVTFENVDRAPLLSHAELKGVEDHLREDANLFFRSDAPYRADEVRRRKALGILREYYHQELDDERRAEARRQIKEMSRYHLPRPTMEHAAIGILALTKTVAFLFCMTYAINSWHRPDIPYAASAAEVDAITR